MRPDCAWNLDELERVQKINIKVMSTFSCGGGSSMGYKLAGCDVIAANDIDPEMRYHYEMNLNPKSYYLCPIKDLLTKDLPTELFNLDILDGSPPCSTFSVAGSREKSWGKDKHFREGQTKQVLSDLFFDYLSLVERLRPKVAIAENVKGMLLGNAKGYTKAVLRRFVEIGYRPQLFLINSADCGVPQKRERVFFVAIRDDIEAPKLALRPHQRRISCEEACADLPSLKKAEKTELELTGPRRKWWALTKPGRCFNHAVMQETGKDMYFSHRRLNGKKPSCTIVASSPTYHWSAPRRISFREQKRLGSFPDDYMAKTDNIGKYMVGMSVPPKMAEVVARAVCEQWLGVKYPGGAYAAA